METGFNGLAAIVTGAGNGIGFEICRQLCERGTSVILNDRNEAIAQEAASRLSAAGGQCVAVAGDAAQPITIDKMVDTAVRQFGRLDIAIANAGITHFGNFLEYQPEHFNQVMQTNAGGSFFLAQRAARQMIAQGSGGSILLMSSVTGHQAHKDLAAYGMSKAAIEMLARTLVIELSPHHITINAIAPGATLTERTIGDPDYAAAWSERTPMGRPASVADIAHAALFLVSPLSWHITGQHLIVDGGWTLISPGP